MPEGDTLEKIARYLRARLIGKTIVTGRMRPDSGQLLAGERINAVQAHGKHLFIRFRSGWGVRTHLGMTGSWHRYSRSEKWQRPVTQASLILQFTDAIYVCFNAKEVQALTDGGIHERSLLRRLGPDLSEENCDLSTIVSRVRHQDGASPVIDILLDQSVAAGIGNVYKSEVLFIERLAPLTPLQTIDDPKLFELYACASALIRGNLDGGPRVTRKRGGARGNLWVYGRAGRACFHCSETIVRAPLGKFLRSTYWCPNCQRPGDNDGDVQASGCADNVDEGSS